MDRLAEARARRAAEITRRLQMPPFLPCLFAPPDQGPPQKSPYYAGPYGLQDVRTHAQEVADVQGANRTPRGDLFQEAIRSDRGIVELPAEELQRTEDGKK